MPLTGLIAMIVFLIRLAEKRNSRPAPSEPLCGRCAFAHIEYFESGGRGLYCAVGGSLRKLSGIVSFCTSFNVRVAPRPRGPVGFVPLENLRNALPEETD